MKYWWFYGGLLATCITACGSATQWGTDLAKAPKEYRVDWVETIPMKESRWAVPYWQRQGKLFFSGELKSGEGFETLKKSAKMHSQLTALGTDRGPAEVAAVTDGGIITNRTTPDGMVYWFSGKFDGRIVKVMLDSSNYVTGVILLTK